MDLPKIYEYLKQKTFSKLFNYSSITLRNNIKLTILNNGRAARGMVYNNVLTASLPNTEAYWYLYKCDNQYLSNLVLGMSDWIDLETVLNTMKVNIDIVTINNRLIPNRMVNVKLTSDNRVVVAINKLAFDKFGESSTAYLVIHTDTDNPNDRRMVSHIPGVHSNISEVLTTFHQQDPNKVLGFIDGFCYRADIFSTSGDPNTDYYELYIDENVVFSFTQDLSQRKTYWSEDEQLYKDIVIIPRELLGDEVHTYDTFTVVVMGKDGKGVYLPFLSDKSVSSLTHGAIGISSHLIDAIYDKLGVEEGDIYVQVSRYTKDNELIPNGRITEELYVHDDTKVEKALLNTLVPPINYWKGSEMEKSDYAKLLTEFDRYREYSHSNLRSLISAWGFYQIAQMFAEHNGEITDLGLQVSQLSLEVPSFWTDKSVYPVLYLNGDKIKHNRYTIERVNSTVTVNFSLPLDIELANSVIQYEWILHTVKRSYITTANPDSQIFLVPRQPGVFRIFKREQPTTIKAVDSNLTTGYKEIALDINPWFNYTYNSTDHIINFNELAFSNQFVMTHDDQVVYTGRPNVDLSLGETLAYIPTTRTIDTDQDIPVLVDANYDVYLNGKYLVPGIDWKLEKLIADSDSTIVGGYQIVVQNLSKLKDDSYDTIDIHQNSRVILERETGYIVDGIIPINPNNEAWIKGISRLFINGRLVPYSKVIRHQTHYEVDPSYWSNGNTYCFEIGISKDFYGHLEDYLDAEYFYGRAEICNHFIHGWSRELPDPIIITFPHRIYSSYLNEIIRRVIAGEIEVYFINDDADILRQVQDYDYLKKFDCYFQENNLIDLKYSDVLPGYLSDVKVADLNHYLYLRRLTKILLGGDQYSDGRIVYLGS